MVILDNVIDYFRQAPLIPVILSALITVIVLLKSFINRRFLLVRFIISALLTFFAVLFFIFYKEITDSAPAYASVLMYIAMLAIEIGAFGILFSVVDLSFSSESFQKELKKSLNETKFYVILNKKDKVREISKCLLDDLKIEESDALGKNFFDVLENKYRLIGLNGQAALKADIKKYYTRYGRKVNPGENNQVELTLQLEDGRQDAMYFAESLIYSGNRYSGRILLGEKKTEESLIGLEKSELMAKNELKTINDRFVAILNKTTDGVFFHNLTEGSIWINPVLLKKLFLNNNTMSTQEFFSSIQPEDLKVYREKIADIKEGSYSVSYRFNAGNYYVYVKEEGEKIINKDSVELCGIMTVVNDYSYEKTDTILDTIKSEDALLNKLKDLYAQERIYELVHFKVTSVPEINEKYGRPIGNMCLSSYVDSIRSQFVDDNMIYRVGGLEFVAVITAYNRMEALKSYLRNDEKILHPNMNYVNDKIRIDVNMGIAVSNEAPTPSDVLKCAKSALNYSLNPKYTSNYVYYKDMRYNG